MNVGSLYASLGRHATLVAAFAQQSACQLIYKVITTQYTYKFYYL